MTESKLCLFLKREKIDPDKMIESEETAAFPKFPVKPALLFTMDPAVSPFRV